jgi:hypothetical protein
MRETAKRALILVPPVLVPLEVIRLARQPSEGPFGNGPIPWFIAAAIALSPAAYYLVWNLFFRRTDF